VWYAHMWSQVLEAQIGGSQLEAGPGQKYETLTKN
jgi:hypothetical protein